jgi:hypothetical protein
MTVNSWTGPWSSLVEHNRPPARRGPVASSRHLRRPGPEGVLTEDGRKVVAFASNDYLGLSLPSGRGGRRPRGPRPLGHRRRRQPSRHRQPALSRGTRRGAGLLEAHRTGRRLPHRLRRQPRRPHRLRRPRGPHLLRRAQPRLHHRRGPPVARRGRRLPPPRRRPPRGPAGRRPRADHRRHRRRLLHGRRRRPGDTTSPTPVAVTARFSSSTRPTTSSAPTSAPTWPDTDVLRVGTLSKTLGSLGGFVAGRPALHRPPREPRPLLHLHHRPHPGRRRRRPGRAPRPDVIRGRPSAPVWPPTSSRWPPATPAPSSPSSSAATSGP